MKSWNITIIGPAGPFLDWSISAGVLEAIVVPADKAAFIADEVREILERHFDRAHVPSTNDREVTGDPIPFRDPAA